MSKADVLLKKAASFEKLALYSDRKSFLQAIAQSQDALQPILTTVQQFVNNSYVNRWDKVKSYTDLTIPAQQLQSIVEQFGSGGPGGGQARASLPKIVPLMDRVIGAAQKNDLMPEAMNSLHQMRDSVAQGLQQASAPAPTQPEVASDTAPQEAEETETMPMDRITGWRPIPRDVQEGLKKLVNPDMKVDGRLGPETRKALDKFRAQYNVPGNAKDQDVFQTIRYHASR